MRKISLLLIVLILFFAGCRGIGSPEKKIELSKEKEAPLLVPEGYEFLTASQWNDGGDLIWVYFLKNKKDGRIYQYQNGILGSEIVIPKGFSLVGVVEGSKSSLTNLLIIYYCRDNKDGKIYLFSSK